MSQVERLGLNSNQLNVPRSLGFGQEDGTGVSQGAQGLSFKERLNNINRNSVVDQKPSPGGGGGQDRLVSKVMGAKEFSRFAATLAPTHGSAKAALNLMKEQQQYNRRAEMERQRALRLEQEERMRKEQSELLAEKYKNDSLREERRLHEEQERSRREFAEVNSF